MGICPLDLLRRPTPPHDDTAIVEAIAAICDEFECYGWRRVRAELRHRGIIVNTRRFARLMREHDLQPRPAPTLCRHDRQRPRPADLSRSGERLTLDGPNQLGSRTSLMSPSPRASSTSP